MMNRHPNLQVGTAGFRVAWWLRGHHAQTLWGKFFRRATLPRGELLRWQTLDGDFIELFRIHSRPEAPRLLVLHGLEGTIRSHYVRGILARAAARGWGADLMIFRGCGEVLNQTLRFYHSGETGDLDFVARRIASEFAGAPIYLVGYSLGGNVVLKWLGEHSRDVPPAVRAAAAISVPYDLAAGAAFVHHGFSRVYERHFLRTLKVKAITKLARFPGILDAAQIRGADSLVAFDEAFTAPAHGFADATDYYRRCSSAAFLTSIRTPTLLLSAFDDPFLPSDRLRAAAASARENPLLEIEFCSHGGHVGFVGGTNPLRPKYYSEDRAFAFFDAHLRSPASPSSSILPRC